MVSSPFSSLSNVFKSSTFVLINSSYNFEISLQNTIFLLLKFFFNSGIILLTFFGDTKKTHVSLNFDIWLKTFAIACFFSGINPKKINFSEKPLIDTAVATAEGPGIGIILILFLIHSLTKIAPGSEILGVPASEINAIVSPDLRRSIILLKFFDSLNLWLRSDVI